MLKKEAREVVGGLSVPSKMPCYGWSTPASRCITGSKLRDVPGSTCSSCYALKGCYVFPVVKDALKRRYQILQRVLSDGDARAEFVQAFTVLMDGQEYFRWHDSGDIQSDGHLELLVDIANACPDTTFWLPTREYSIVNTFLGVVPSNLVIRVSSHMVDHGPVVSKFKTSTVHSNGHYSGLECGAYKRGGECGTCRLCWSSDKNISYKVH